MTETERGNWSNWCEFFLSSLGYMVGLGNIWRFPYLCYKNGGGAFLIPYFSFLFICVVPLLCLEFCCCQFSNLGPGRVWIMCPLFKGIGIGMIVVNTIASIYYTVIISWALYYLAMSFSAVLPWSTCENVWNTPYCHVRGSPSDNGNVTSTPITENTFVGPRTTPSEEFWNNHVLELSGGIEEMGEIRWQLLLCLLAVWVAAILCFIKGIKTSGKVMYVAATAPYLLLLILLIRGLFLPGAMSGLKSYLIPEWKMLLKPTVWSEAAIQLFYSIGLGTANVATVASYNKFHNNIIRDTFLLAVMDGLTSLFAGMVIFVTLGFMAQQSGLEVFQVVSEGPGIAFMVYPEALSQLPLPQFWSVCFFLLLCTVGLKSQIVHLQTISSGIMDNIPRLRNKFVPVNLIYCVPSFGLGIFCITQGGVYVLQLMDWYCASITMMLFPLLQVVVLAFVYGTGRLYADMELMLGYRPSIFWKISWLVICPVILGSLWIMNLVNMKNVTYGDYMFPPWTTGVGWLIATVSIIMLPTCMLHTILSGRGSLMQRLRQSIKPTSEWGPVKKELKDAYRERYADISLDETHVRLQAYAMKPML